MAAARFGRWLGAATALFLGALILLPLASFLSLAITPRLFDQGRSWFTLAPLGQAFSGEAVVALWHTALVGAGAGFLAVGTGFLLAWGIERAAPYGKGLWRLLVLLLLLTPTYLLALGVERLVEVGGVLERAGLAAGWLRGVVIGPVGLVLLLGLKGAPFAYLAVGSALPAAGSRIIEAARVHGAGRVRALRLLAGAIAPALWAAFAVVFAEAISDFGIAYTLAAPAHFELSTFYLYAAVDREPIQFPLAAGVGVTIVGLCALAVAIQRRSLRGRGYALLRGGYAPPPPSTKGRVVATVLIGLYFLFALGIPGVGTVSASLLRSLGTATHSFALTLANYRAAVSSGALWSPLAYSGLLAASCATVAVFLATVVARIAQLSRGQLGAFMEQLTLAVLGVPAIVVGAGLILFWNLPFLHALHLALYGTTLLLALGYLVAAVPSGLRLISASLTGMQGNLLEAAQAHGAGWGRRWLKVGLPLLSRPLIYAWLWTFVGILLELPLSSLLFPPGHFPLAVAINRRLEAYEFSVGTAMEVVAVGLAAAFCGLVLLLFRRFAPAGLKAIRVAG